MTNHQTEDELKVENEAFEYIKSNRDELIKKYASLEEYMGDVLPSTIFMAGSPGAGKTEFSIRLIENFKQKPVRIDADEIREFVPEYEGSKAYLFQKAANKGVNILFDHCLKHGLNLLLDGTFAYADSLGNIERSLKRDRNVEIYFLYQEPAISWEFTKKREAREKRNVPKDAFIHGFCESIENVTKAKQEFGKDIKLNLAVKSIKSGKGLEKFELNISNIEDFLPKRYTKSELKRLLE